MALKPIYVAVAVVALTLAGRTQKPLAPQPNWTLDGLVIVGGRMVNQTPAVRDGILQATGAKLTGLRVARIRTPAGHLFIVQGLGEPLCSASGNCSAWVLDEGYHVLLTTTAESFRLQASSVPGQLDLVTYVEGPVDTGDLKRWQFDGRGAYRRIACAHVTQTRSGPKQPLVPQIAPVSCGR